jgi:hypothetical protein
MNIDFESKIKNIYGNEILGEDEKPIRLGSFCVNALLGVYEDEKDLAGNEKVSRTILAEKLVKKTKGTDVTYAKISLEAEDIVLLKSLSNKMFPAPSIYTAIVRLLEGKTERKISRNGSSAATDNETEEENQE